MLRRALPSLAVAVLLATPLASAATVDIAIQGFAYNPKVALLAPGDTARWTNMDGPPHTATSFATPPDFDTPNLLSGQQASASLAPGTYPYFCKVHPPTGFPNFRGVVQVGPNTAPSVSSDLADNDLLQGVVAVAGAAPDAEGPHTWVRVTVDGAPLTSGILGLQVDGPGSAFSIPWNTNSVANGPHVLVFNATDGLAFAPQLSVTVVVDNPLLPDLTIVSFTAPSTGPVTRDLRAMVKNTGTLAAPASEVAFAYHYQGQDHLIATLPSPALAPGQSALVNATWDATGKVGTWTLRATVDPAGLVAESIETNNAASATTTVLLSGPPVDLLDPA